MRLLLRSERLTDLCVTGICAGSHVDIKRKLMGTGGGSSLATAAITTAARNSSLERNSTIVSVIFGYMERLMRKPEFSLAPILILTGVAWFTTSSANSPTTIADPPATTISGPADVSSAEKAVAARKERCRLHPGTCKRSQQKPEPPKSSDPG